MDPVDGAFQEDRRTDMIWNRVYDFHCNNPYYKAKWAENLQYYEGLRQVEYQSLDACVGNALKTGGHAAFARIFLNGRFSQGNIFSRVLNEYLAKYEGKVQEWMQARQPGKKLKAGDLYPSEYQWGKFKIFKSSAWRSSDHSYDEFTNEKEFASRSLLSLWQSGKNLPDKDQTVQIAVCMGLGWEDTDRLLHAAGSESLYILDAVDACAAYFLDRHKGDYSIPPFEKLKKLKKSVNDSLIHLLEPRMPVVVFSKKRVLFSGGKLGWDIDKEISEWRDWLETEDGEREESLLGDTRYLTEYFVREMRTCDSLQAFMDSTIRKSGHSVLAQKYYGFLRKTRQYLEAADHYSKNIIGDKAYHPWNLSPEGPGIEISQVEKERLCARQELLAVREHGEEAFRKRCLRELNKVWYRKTVDADTLERNTPRGNFSVLGFMIEGRPLSSIAGKKNVKIIFPSGQRNQPAGRKSVRSRLYRLTLTDKQYLMRFLLAAGREDDIGTYLMQAGYWDRNWYTDDVFKRTDLQNEILTRTELLFLYALHYRDSLIEAWCKREERRRSGIDRNLRRVILRDNFPMVQLVLEIGRDLTYIYLEGEKQGGRIDETWEPVKDCPHPEIKKQLSRYQKDMIYDPILL